MNRFWTIFLTILLCSHLTAVLGQKIEIPLEDKHFIAVKHWVAPDGYVLLDVFYQSNNHYFYFIDPKGKVISKYKNFFPSIYYTGFTSNEREFTLYFSRNLNGKIEFIDFFKEGSRPPILTTWENDLEGYFKTFNINGELVFVNYEKKRGVLQLNMINGPIEKSRVYEFDIEKELAKKMSNYIFRGRDISNIYHKHDVGGHVYLENQNLIILENSWNELRMYRFDLTNEKLTTKDYAYPLGQKTFRTISDSFLLEDKIFVMAVNRSGMCFDMLDTELKVIFSRCYGEEDNLDFRYGPVVNSNGKNVEDGWREVDDQGSRLISKLAQRDVGFLSAIKNDDGGYSLKFGAEASLATSTGITVVGGKVASSIYFPVSLSNDFLPMKDGSNFFDEVFSKTGVQVAGGMPDAIVYSKFFYKMNYDKEESKIILERFTFD